MTTPISRTLCAVLTMAAIVAACSTAPASPSDAGGAPSSPAVPAHFPIGAWTSTITEDDLRAGGVTGDGELGENAGLFTMTMADDGTWTTAQVADVALRWPVFRGTWTVTGPASFSQRTTFPTDFVGDLVDFTWKVENGSLILKVVNPPDHILPIIMETHPWQLAG